MNRAEFRTLAQLARSSDPQDPRQTDVLVDQVYRLRDQTGQRNDTSGIFEAAALLAKHTLRLEAESVGFVREIVARLLDTAGGAYGESAAPDGRSDSRAGRGVVFKQEIPKELTETRLRLVSDMYLGELLVRDGAVSQETLDKALGFQRVTGDRLGETLIEMGATTWDKIESALRVQGRRAEDAGRARGA